LHIVANVAFIIQIPAVCRNRYLDFKFGHLHIKNDRGRERESVCACARACMQKEHFLYHIISVDKMCTSLEICMINYSSKKYMKENTLPNCRVLFLLVEK